MRALVAGGSGCIGTHVVRALQGAGHDVTVLARHAVPLDPGVALLRADRDDPAALARALGGAAFDLTVDLLGWDAAGVDALHGPHHARLGRVVMISSGQVCLVARDAVPPFVEADGERAPMDEPPAGTNDHVQWTYGMGKRGAEAALRAHAARTGTPCAILRLPIVQGAGDRSLRLQAWIDRLRDGGPVLRPDGGTRRLRFVWAGDVGAAMVALAGRWQRGERVGDVYHLAQPEIVTLAEFLDALARAMGVRAEFVDVPAAALPPDVSADAWPYTRRWCSVLDPSRAAGEWGFRGTPLADYLPGVVAAHLASPQGSDAGYAQRPQELALARELARS